MKNHVFSQTSLGLNVVAIGGGNGLSTVLEGLKKYVDAKEDSPTWINTLSAIVAVSDDGGSSGRLRDELNVLPPGDIRNCMVALSEDSHLLAQLFRHRFKGEGALGGHSFGNLFLAALSEITGDFSEAVRLSSEILASKGQIFPATMEDVRLAATLDDGSIVRGETNVGKVGNKIVNLSLEPETCLPVKGAIDAIRNANLITIGPGSLYTSILPPLLVKDVAANIARSSAKKVFICNLMTQPGETEGYSAFKHLEVINQYVPEIVFDYVVVNNYPINDEQSKRYENQGAMQIGVGNSMNASTSRGTQILFGNLLDEKSKVRHNPEKLADVILLSALQDPRMWKIRTQTEIGIENPLVI